MFLLIPLLIIFGSALAITAIIWRKKSYLKEMIATGGNTPEFNLNPNFSFMEYGMEFFPELVELFKRIKINRYKSIGLMEAEKSLRKARLIFLKIDRLSDVLIKKIRRVHLNGQLKVHTAEEKLSEDSRSDAVIHVVDNKVSEKKSISPNFLKNEEQRLIIEIAKNPKDAHLYEVLGDLYIEMENFVDAKESYEASIELSPQNGSLKIKLSEALEKLAQK